MSIPASVLLPTALPTAMPHGVQAPRKKVLLVLYSQTGQLANIAQQISAPLQADSHIEVQVEVLKPVREYPFPWPFFRFLDTFPESAHMTPEALQPLGVTEVDSYDLIVLCYQVWFLAPSRPIVAFLKSPVAAQLLAGRPVVTVVACRNMWMMAHKRMCDLLQSLQVRHLDNVVLTDRAATLATLLTTPLWLLTGRKKPVPGLPEAGVSRQEIAGCTRFGQALRDALHANREQHDAPLLSGLQAVQAEPALMVSEKAGTRSFHVWGKLLRWAGPPGAWQRQPLLVLYVIFLFCMIVTVVPISLTLQWLLRPFLQRRLAQLKLEFERPSGSGTERLHLYTPL